MCFITFGNFILKWTFLRLLHFSLSWSLSKQLNFSVAVCIYKIDVFDEAFSLLTMRILMMTKLFNVVTCCEELSHINIHDITTEWSSGVAWQIKYISPPSKDVSTPHKVRSWLSERGSQIWAFNQVTNVRSRDYLKYQYLYFHKVYSKKTW